MPTDPQFILNATESSDTVETFSMQVQYCRTMFSRETGAQYD